MQKLTAHRPKQLLLQKSERHPFSAIGVNLLAVTFTFLAVGFADAEPAFSSSDAGHAPASLGCVEGTTPCPPTKKRKFVGRIVPVVPIWTAISHNPLVMLIRFHGVVKAVRKEIDLGALRIPNIGKTAKIKLAGTRKIDGETLPFVSIRYPKKGVSAEHATFELANMTGRIDNLRLDFAVRVPNRSDKKLVFAYLDPGHLLLDAQEITGSESTSFAAPFSFSAGETRITNPVPVAVKRSTPSRDTWATGELRLDSNDLNFNQVTLRFQGENNVLNLSGQVTMPNQLVWTYDLFERRLIWKSGQLQIANLVLQPVPQHQINFGGIALTLNAVKIDTASITRTEFPTNSLPSVGLTGVSLDASDLAYKGSTLKGTLKAPITIKQINGLFDFKSFTDMNLSNQIIQNMQLGLTNINYQSGTGLQIQAGSLDISVPKYTSIDLGGSTPETNVTASITLKDAPVTQQDGGSFQIDQLTADLQGPTDKLDGRGSLSGTLSGVKQDVQIDLSKVFNQDCSDQNARLMRLSLSQLASASVTADIDVFNGEPSGFASVPVLLVHLDGGYGRCDWDGNPIGVTILGHQLDIGTVHWEAQFNPVPLGLTGGLILAEIRFDKQGAKICRGHLGAVGLGIWEVQVNPTFNDCGSFLCNIPRDIVNGLFGGFEFPYSNVLNQAAIGLVDTVGLFDAGILCQ